MEETHESPLTQKKRPFNAKHALFARLVAQGETLSKAYAVVYGIEDDTSGSRLLALPGMKELVAQMRHPLLVDSMMGLEEKRLLLNAVVNTDVMRLVNDDGSLNLHEARRLPPGVIQDISITESTSRSGTVVRKVRIKLLDKLRAIEIDNELAGHGDGNAASNDDDNEEIRKARASARQVARGMISEWTKRGLFPQLRVTPGVVIENDAPVERAQNEQADSQ